MLVNKDGAARLRRLWLNVHLWSGLSVGVLLVALGLSGSLLVWRDSLDRLGNPARGGHHQRPAEVGGGLVQHVQLRRRMGILMVPLSRSSTACSKKCR